MGGLDGRIGALDERVDRVDAQLEGIDDRLDEIDDQLGQIGAQLTQLLAQPTPLLAKPRSPLVADGPPHFDRGRFRSCVRLSSERPATNRRAPQGVHNVQPQALHAGERLRALLARPPHRVPLCRTRVVAPRSLTAPARWSVHARTLRATILRRSDSVLIETISIEQPLQIARWLLGVSDPDFDLVDSLCLKCDNLNPHAVLRCVGLPLARDKADGLATMRRAPVAAGALLRTASQRGPPATRNLPTVKQLGGLVNGGPLNQAEGVRLDSPKRVPGLRKARQRGDDGRVSWILPTVSQRLRNLLGVHRNRAFTQKLARRLPHSRSSVRTRAVVRPLRLSLATGRNERPNDVQCRLCVGQARSLKISDRLDRIVHGITL